MRTGVPFVRGGDDDDAFPILLSTNEAYMSRIEGEG